MLSTTIDQNRLHLTADLRAVEGTSLKSKPKMSTPIFATDLRRFPPVEDVVVAGEHDADVRLVAAVRGGAVPVAEALHADPCCRAQRAAVLRAR